MRYRLGSFYLKRKKKVSSELKLLENKYWSCRYLYILANVYPFERVENVSGNLMTQLATISRLIALSVFVNSILLRNTSHGCSLSHINLIIESNDERTNRIIINSISLDIIPHLDIRYSRYTFYFFKNGNITRVYFKTRIFV